MKKILMRVSLLLVIIFCVTPFSAYATTSGTEPEISERFVAICDLVFSGKGEVYNSEGIEITQDFVNAYLGAYNTGNYDTILGACYDMGISRILGHGDKIMQPSTRAFMTLSYEEHAVHFVTQEGPPYDGKSWHFIVTATGTYVYNDGYQRIEEVRTPTISASYHDIGAAFAGSLDSVRTTTPIISSDGSYATFNVTTTHTVGCPIPGVGSIMGTLGPFTHVSYFTIGL